jgi:hypothetical protein
MRLSLNKVLYDVNNFEACGVVQLGEFFENGIHSEFFWVFKNS